MKVVLTLTSRNEADLIDANLAFHLNAGVDFVLVTDNDSTDGTTDVLERYARDGVLRWTSAADPEFSQIESVQRMAREGATKLSADWVVNSDADEFWWPRGGTLKDVFAAVPARFGSVRGMLRHFVPRPQGDGPVIERMTVRVAAPVTHKDHTFSPHFKTAHRGDPEVRIGGGNHEVYGRALLPLRGWYPIDILHFPLRSLEQCQEKYLRWWMFSQSPRVPAPRVTEFYEAYRQGRAGEFYDSHVVDDESLAEGLRDGTLAIDTRLRAALRSLARGDAPLSFTENGVDRSYVAEVAALEEQNTLVRTQRRVEALERRLSALEKSLPARVRARLAARTPA
jgi:hypothetical protein